MRRTTPPAFWLRALLTMALVYVCALSLAQNTASPAAQRPLVYVAPIEGMIDLGLAPYVARILKEAEAAGAAAVVLKINTFGGRVDAAVQIRDALLGSKMRSIAFVDKRAISAGALIALASNEIYMSGGSTIGAATPVMAGQPGEGMKATDEKTVSYVRKEFSATAESRNRSTQIAEAMVDPDVAIAGVVEKGKLLTLTTQEAVRNQLAVATVADLQAMLEHAGLPGAELRSSAPNWAEQVVRFLTTPIVSSLLVTLATLGIMLEIRTPGFGVPGAVGIGSLGLFLWGHWLVQLAGWEEFLLVGAGLVLLLVEVFVIPGFGVAGALGLLALLAGLVLSLLGPGPTGQVVMLAAGRIAGALLLAMVGSLVLMRFIGKLPVGRRLVLSDELDAAHGYTAESERDHRLLGRSGTSLTPLRPAGLAEIDGERVDVVSDGELIEPSQPVQVVRVDGNRVVVRRVRAATLASASEARHEPAAPEA